MVPFNSFLLHSCAWRHCGAFADAQEALDELESLVGVFEPFECLFCLDVVERSFRDMLAVTKDFQDPNIVMREYESLKRMVRCAFSTFFSREFRILIGVGCSLKICQRCSAERAISMRTK